MKNSDNWSLDYGLSCNRDVRVVAIFVLALTDSVKNAFNVVTQTTPGPFQNSILEFLQFPFHIVHIPNDEIDPIKIDFPIISVYKTPHFILVNG